MKKSSILISLTAILLFLTCHNALADRASRSEKVREKAQAWCAEYTRLHDGAECHVVRKINLCPKGFRAEKVFKKFRSNDYKACIKGKKREVVKKGAQKALNAVQGTPLMPVGNLVMLYKRYFSRIQNHSTDNQPLPKWIIEKYQRYFKKNLKKVRVAESTKVYPNNAMTDCDRIYFPKGRLRGVLVPDRDGKASEWLLHELWHTEQCKRKGGRNNYAAMWFRTESIGIVNGLAKGEDKYAKRVHDNNPMEKDAAVNAKRLRRY